QVLDRRCGGSTGTNVYAAFEIIAELSAAGESGSVVSMLCDGGERYLDSYYNDEWLKQKGFDLKPYLTQLDNFYASGKFR
ncbi:MAG: PLP-dependent cysteine synthase family protein, partial [Gammaproteobacteria bacterium]